MASPDRKFTLFPLLPPELRLLIFTFALPSPRDFYFYPPDGYFNRLNRATLKEFTSNTFLYPGLFCVNTEARQLALRHYQLYYLRTIPKDILSKRWTVWVDDPVAEGGQVAGIYWDAERDMALYSECHGTLRLPVEPQPLPVKNVCLAAEEAAKWKDILQTGDRHRILAFLGNVKREFPEAKRIYGIEKLKPEFLADEKDLPRIIESSKPRT